MARSAQPVQRGTEASLPQRALQAMIEMASSLRQARPSSGDLLDTLKQEEVKVLARHWPGSGPSGDGVSYYDKTMRIRLRRLAWRARVETGGELVWLVSKLGGVLVCLGFVWEHVVG